MATLLPGHLTYKQWANPTVALYKDIYFFNLTNPEEFEKGATPVVKEVGPYRYRCAGRWIGGARENNMFILLSSFSITPEKLV